MPVVVVESPAKAKTINKYLGPRYTVLASYGHVRDLPPKDGSVDTDNGFDMKWDVSADSRKHVKAIADALAEDGELILARGMRLDIAAGTAVRFEPGQRREVQLIPVAGGRRIYGFNQQVMGEL